MTWAVIGTVVFVAVLFLVMLVSLMCAAPMETLEEQAECIRKEIEERERKKQHREMKRQRRRAKWQR